MEISNVVSIWGLVNREYQRNPMDKVITALREKSRWLKKREKLQVNKTRVPQTYDWRRSVSCDYLSSSPPIKYPLRHYKTTEQVFRNKLKQTLTNIWHCKCFKCLSAQSLTQIPHKLKVLIKIYRSKCEVTLISGNTSVEKHALKGFPKGRFSDQPFETPCSMTTEITHPKK